jgi:hypothetical protein
VKHQLSFLFSALPLVAATIALSLAPSGCNGVGCFRAAEAGGECPAQEDALPFFGDPGCGGLVASVESDATIRKGNEEEGPLCCYSVANKAAEYEECPDF